MSIFIGFMVLSELIPPLPPRRAQDNPPPLPLHSPHTVRLHSPSLSRFPPSSSCRRRSGSPCCESASSLCNTNKGSSSNPCPPATAMATTTTAPSSSSINKQHHRHSMTPISSTGVNVAQTALISVDHAAVLASLFVPPPPLPHSVFNFTAQQPKDNACGFSL
jgi:hypothetical protein